MQSVTIEFKNGVPYMTTDPIFNETKQKAKQWLSEFGYGIQEISEPGKAWVIVAQAVGQNPIAVMMNLDSTKLVICGMNLTLPEFRSSIDALLPFQKKNLVFDLRIELIKLEKIDFDVPDSLDEIKFNTFIFCDELTQANLIASVSRVNRAIRMCVWMLQKKFTLNDNGNEFDLSSHAN